MEVFMKTEGEGYKHLNLLISIKTYWQLIRLSIKSRKPVAEIVREGIEFVLEHHRNRKD